MLTVLAMFNMLKNRIEDNEVGGVVIEYGIVVAVIALGLATVGQGLVTAIGTWFGDIATSVQAL